jgi:hypothetical protein
MNSTAIRVFRIKALVNERVQSTLKLYPDTSRDQVRALHIVEMYFENVSQSIPFAKTKIINLSGVLWLQVQGEFTFTAIQVTDEISFLIEPKVCEMQLGTFVVKIKDGETYILGFTNQFGKTVEISDLQDMVEAFGQFPNID